jgi:hypothetical protein
MAQQDFATLKAFYDGQPMVYVTSISHVINSGQIRVDLIEVGLAGWTPGSGDCTIEIGYPVLLTGTEFPYKTDAANGRYVTLQISEGDTYYIGMGKIQTASSSQSANASTEGTFTWTGELKPMEA